MPFLLLALLAVCYYPSVDSSYGPSYRHHPQQHYPSPHRWNGGDDPPLPQRIRMGEGRYKLEGNRAQLTCQFPESVTTLSNVIWERADLGSGKSLEDMYSWAGHVQRYTVYLRPSGSTLMLESVVPHDRGLYRCIVTAKQPTTNKLVTIFQDVFFYPELERHENQHYRPRPHQHDHGHEENPMRPPLRCHRQH